MNILLRIAILINLIVMIIGYKDNNIYSILVTGFGGVISAIILTMYEDNSR